MSKITIYSTCRSFDHPRFNLIQRNAIGSWIQLKPRPGIVLMGDDPGVKQICEEFQITHFPFTSTTKQGTPYLHDMMDTAEKISFDDIFLLISSDIILFQDTIDVIQKLLNFNNKFMASAFRYEKNVEHLIDFTDPFWEQKVKEGMVQGSPAAGDYFLYTRGYWENGILPFAIGRARCDNWLAFEAKRIGYYVNVTEAVTILHQDHDHSHISGDMEGLINGPEFAMNDSLARGARVFTLQHANWVLNAKGIENVERAKEV